MFAGGWSIVAAVQVAAGPAVAVQAEAPIVAEARAFMEAYAKELSSGNRAALAARYDRRGAWRVGMGMKRLFDHAELTELYRTKWPQPAAFAWEDLSYEVAGPDAVVVLGKFLWTQKAGEKAERLTYTGLLVRQDGVLRIRLEDEDPEPEPKPAK